MVIIIVIVIAFLPHTIIVIVVVMLQSLSLLSCMTRSIFGKGKGSAQERDSFREVAKHVVMFASN